MEPELSVSSTSVSSSPPGAAADSARVFAEKAMKQ